MNGAQALIRTLVDGGVDVCFANPGTSEMHFVAALDAVPAMRGVLALFEGVATGAADGYARMADKPAAVLLHLGPGLGNGLANLHNARRAHVPMVVVVGDHATYHKKLRRPTGIRHRRTGRHGVGLGAAQRPHGRCRRGCGRRDHRQSDRIGVHADPARRRVVVRRRATGARSAPRRSRPLSTPRRCARRPSRCAPVSRRSILIGGDATRTPGLSAAVRAADATGARVLCETFPTRLERGAGVPAVERLAYFAEAAQAQLAGASHLILAGATSPVSFFAYPGKPSDLVPEGCKVQVLAEYRGAAAALEQLADEVAPGTRPGLAPASRPELPSGPLTAPSAARGHRRTAARSGRSSSTSRTPRASRWPPPPPAHPPTMC